MAWCGLLGLVKCMPTFGSKPLVASKPQVIVMKSCVGLFFIKQNLRFGLVLASWAVWNSKKSNTFFYLYILAFFFRNSNALVFVNRATFLLRGAVIFICGLAASFWNPFTPN